MNEFEDIEQLLKPQCEFKASDTLKQEVMEKARQEVSPRRIVRMWPWLAAACVVGFVVMFLMPPKPVLEEKPLVAKVVTPKAEETKQAESTPEPVCVNVETPKRQKAKRPRKVVKDESQDEPVQMSEESRMELLLASLNADEPQMEDINTEEEIRQIRMRGERLISIYEENDK